MRRGVLVALLVVLAPPVTGGSARIEPTDQECGENCVWVADPGRGGYRVLRARLTRREQVLAIIDEHARPLGREIGDNKQEPVQELGHRCRYTIAAAGKRIVTPRGWACLMQPHLKVRVEKIGNGLFRYWYGLRNARRAQANISAFAIDLPRADILLARRDAEGWLLLDLGGVPLYLGRLQERTRRVVAMWAPELMSEVGDGDDQLTLGADEHVGPVSVTSAYAPALAAIRFLGDVYVGKSPED